MMQTSLGELHDCDVWIDELGPRLKRAARGSRLNLVNAGERAAGVYLLRDFTRKRTEHYRDALARWEKWEATNFLARFKTLTTNSRGPRR